MEGKTATVRLTEEGSVLGTEYDNHYRWTGIPFAAALTKETRFDMPTAASKRQGILDCTVFRPAAFQARENYSLPIGEDDDCLTLNIWAPKETETIFPCFVFIHGGGFIGGTGAGYHGSEMCIKERIVVVTINYRLGCFGFSNLASVFGDRFPTNVGLHDQVRALLWIQRNIASFGGDPQNVTVGGESAGAVSVAMLITMSQACQYFKRAIMQSKMKEICHNAWEISGGSFSLVDDAERSSMKAKSFLVQLIENALSASEKGTDACKKAMERDDLGHSSVLNLLLGTESKELQRAVSISATNTQLPVGPWFDGKDFASSIEDAFARVASDKELLIGHNKDEMMLWVLTYVEGEKEELPFTEAAVKQIFKPLDEASFEKIRATYDPSLEANSDIWQAIATDALFVNTTRRLADAMAARGATVYRYRVDRFCDQGPMRSCVPHACELLAFWDMPWSRTFHSKERFLSPATRELIVRMRKDWGSFIRGDSLDEWPRYDSKRKSKIYRCDIDGKAMVLEGPESVDRILAWSPVELLL